MERNLISNDRTINTFMQIVDNNILIHKMELISIVLYGSKAIGDRNSNNDYDFLIILSNDTSLKNYTRFVEKLKLDLIREKLCQVKFITYTADNFEEILYEEPMLGTVLYIICKENVVFYDKQNTFSMILERISQDSIKNEEEFIKQCIEFARLMGSEKWQRKYEKLLLQHKYSKKRRNT